MKILIKAAIFLSVIYFSGAQALECKIANPEELVWIVAININESTGDIKLTQGEAQGKRVLKTRLVDLSDDRYTFNLAPQEGVKNMFLLFKSFEKWRLINAGVEEKNGTTVLRAIEESKEYNCFKK